MIVQPLMDLSLLSAGATPILRTQTINRPQGRGPQLARTQTVEFAATPQPINAERRFSPIPQSPGEDEAAYGTSHHRRKLPTNCVNICS